MEGNSFVLRIRLVWEYPITGRFLLLSRVMTWAGRISIGGDKWLFLS